MFPFIVFCVGVVDNNIKGFSVAIPMQHDFALHYYRTTKYLVLLLAVICIKEYECAHVCMYSCLSHPAYKLHSFAPCYISFYGLSRSTTYFHILSQTVRIEGGKRTLLNIKCFMYVNQQDAQNSCDQTLFFNIRPICFGLYQSIFRSNFISCTSHLVYVDTSGCCVAIATYATGIYQIRHTAYKKIAPEDGLIQSETCRAYIEK